MKRIKELLKCKKYKADLWGKLCKKLIDKESKGKLYFMLERYMLLNALLGSKEDREKIINLIEQNELKKVQKLLGDSFDLLKSLKFNKEFLLRGLKGKKRVALLPKELARLLETVYHIIIYDPNRGAKFNRDGKMLGSRGKTLVKKRKTDFGLRFLDKQRLKIFYGNLKESDLRKILKLIRRLEGNYWDNFFTYLESSVEFILVRSSFVSDIFEAKELIKLGMIRINDKRVSKPGIKVNVGDILTISDFDKKNEIKKKVEDLREKGLIYVPSHLEVNYNLLEIIMVRKTNFLDLWYPFEVKDVRNLADYYLKI